MIRSVLHAASSALSLSLVLAPPCAAQGTQKPLEARNFLFDHHGTVILLDVQTARTTGVLDELSTSLASPFVATAAAQVGVDLATLDRVTSVREPAEGGGHRMVTVVETSSALLPLEQGFFGRFADEALGPYTLRVDQWSQQDGVVDVSARLRVFGPLDHLRAVLGGEPRSGLPSADVMSLTAGEKNVLFQFVVDLRNDTESQRALREALPETKWPDGDRPTYACGRLRATDDALDPHVVAELVLRHGTAGEGLAVSERAVDAALDGLAKMPQARLFRPVLSRIERERDGTDARWRVDLGRARDFGGLLGMMTPLLYFARSTDVQVVRVEAAPPPPPVEPPPPPPPQPDEPPAGGGG